MKKTFFFLMIIGFAACSNPKIFEETVYFDNLIWNRFEIIEHSFTIEEPEQLYDLKVLFKHTPTYSTDHIVLNLTLYYSNGGFRSRDYEFRLQDDQQQWLVDSKGGIFTHEFLILQGISFPEAGAQKIRIENKMTKFNLTDVAGVGFVVEKTKKK